MGSWTAGVLGQRLDLPLTLFDLVFDIIEKLDLLFNGMIGLGEEASGIVPLRAFVR
jgi:hypothetical protein